MSPVSIVCLGVSGQVSWPEMVGPRSGTNIASPCVKLRLPASLTILEYILRVNVTRVLLLLFNHRHLPLCQTRNFSTNFTRPLRFCSLLDTVSPDSLSRILRTILRTILRAIYTAYISCLLNICRRAIRNSAHLLSVVEHCCAIHTSPTLYHELGQCRPAVVVVTRCADFPLQMLRQR